MGCLLWTTQLTQMRRVIIKNLTMAELKEVQNSKGVTNLARVKLRAAVSKIEVVGAKEEKETKEITIMMEATSVEDLCREVEVNNMAVGNITTEQGGLQRDINVNRTESSSLHWCKSYF